MQPDLRKPLLDAPQQALKPFDLEIGMQPALHQDTGATHFNGLRYLLIDCLEVKDVSLSRPLAVKGAIKSTEAAVFRAEICVVDVAVYNVGDYTLRMQFAAKRICLHSQTDEIVGSKIIESLLSGN